VSFDDPELLCWGCHDWFPLTLEFWPSRVSFGLCRACTNERARLYQARKRMDPEHRRREVQKSKRYRAYLKGIDIGLVEVEDREQRLRRMAEQQRYRDREVARERRREKNREWMRQYRARERAA